MIDYNIDEDDLKALYAATRHAYGNLNFQDWKEYCKNAYVSYFKDRDNPKTFSEWVNGQIIHLTS